MAKKKTLAVIAPSLREWCCSRRQIIEQAINREIVAGNTVKESQERHALAELTAIEQQVRRWEEPARELTRDLAAAVAEGGRLEVARDAFRSEKLNYETKARVAQGRLALLTSEAVVEAGAESAAIHFYKDAGAWEPMTYAHKTLWRVAVRAAIQAAVKAAKKEQGF